MSRIRRRTARATVLLLAALAAGCSMPQLRWPWRAEPPAAPEAADELLVTSLDGTSAAFPKYWQRNTLVLDLQRAAGSGRVALRPRDGGAWPVRLAFLVTPGAIGRLEVQADQRVILPIAPEGGRPVQLELEPSAYSPATPEIVVSWAADSGCCVSSGPAQSAPTDR